MKKLPIDLDEVSFQASWNHPRLIPAGALVPPVYAAALVSRDDARFFQWLVITAALIALMTQVKAPRHRLLLGGALLAPLVAFFEATMLEANVLHHAVQVLGFLLLLELFRQVSATVSRRAAKSYRIAQVVAAAVAVGLFIVDSLGNLAFAWVSSTLVGGGLLVVGYVMAAVFAWGRDLKAEPPEDAPSL